MNDSLSFWKATIKLITLDDKGREKKVSESYIVKAVSPTDVEVKMAKELEGFDYIMSSISAQKIVSIVE